MAGRPGPDVVCLQETKLEDKAFPRMELEAAGYQAAFAGQKTYNGVAILARSRSQRRGVGIPGFVDEQRRLIAATLDERAHRLRLFPQWPERRLGQVRLQAEMDRGADGWLREELARHPSGWRCSAITTSPRRRATCTTRRPGKAKCCSRSRSAPPSAPCSTWGLKDAFRLFEQPEKVYSWWDYRMMAFRRNMGLRIDHILLSRRWPPDARPAGWTRRRARRNALPTMRP
jgi:exodeoxyribonuclease-3